MQCVLGYKKTDHTSLLCAKTTVSVKVNKQDLRLRWSECVRLNEQLIRNDWGSIERLLLMNSEM